MILMNKSLADNVSFIVRLVIAVSTVVFTYLGTFAFAEAATLSLSPSTGVYTSGSTFSVKVMVNTGGQSVNAADGVVSFNPKELSVVSINRSSSIFNLWVAEPSFSNSAGTISFSGGSPAGFTGQTGSIMTVTFRAAGAGTARVNYKSGSVLANDGRGTNILTSMNGGTYTIQAATVAPEPEVIEYIAPANTPSAPVIKSATHGDPNKWHASDEAVLNWSLPSDVTAVRTLLNDNPTSVPTKVYDSPINTITLSDLEEGVSYFHIQFQNAEGWGRVTHYRLAVDTENPSDIKISHPEGADLANPNQVLSVLVEDATSDVKRFKIKVDSTEPVDYVDETGSSTIPLSGLNPGYHSVIVEAFDEAGNSIVGTYSFTIESFNQPVFTEYPSEINEEVIPVIKGQTRQNSSVEVTLRKVGGEAVAYTVTSDSSGVFTFIPEGTFSTGVYELTAVATDEHGAQSDVSDPIRIAVQQPGLIRIGSLIVSVLSVIIPLIVLVFLLVVGGWYMFVYMRRFRKRVRVESAEALEILHREFTTLQGTLRKQEASLLGSRKTKKLTKAEAEMIEVLDRALQLSQRTVEKEIEDVAKLTRKKQNT